MPVDRTALAGLGALAQTPLARAAVKYWWVSLPIGYAAYRSWQQRKAKGGAHPLDVVMDIAPLVGLVGTLVLINEHIKRNEVAAPAAAKPSPIPPGAEITDADFTTRPDEARRARLAPTG
jgi:hypothetical protein